MFEKMFLHSLVLVSILVVYTQSAAVSTVAPIVLQENSSINTRNAEGTLFSMCPKMLAHVFQGAAPQDESAAGVYKKYVPAELSQNNENGEVDLSKCIAGCCAANNNHSLSNRNNSSKSHNNNNNCNVVFVFKQNCYHVRCFNNEGCLPIKRSKFKQLVQMVLVQPIIEHDEHLTWAKVLRETKKKHQVQHVVEWDQFLNSGGQNVHDANSVMGTQTESAENLPMNLFNQKRKFHFSNRKQETPFTYDDEEFPLAEKRVKQLMMSPMDVTPDEINYFNSNLRADTLQSCDMELSDLTGRRCRLHEQCVHGVCKCMREYIRNELGECVLPNEIDYSQIMDAAASEMVSAAVNEDELLTQDSTSKPVKTGAEEHLQVTVASKVVRLPEQQVTLTAITQPSESESGIKYKYLWTLVTQPKGPINGTITDQSESMVRLFHLSEGLYTFKVSVSGGDGISGEAEANVTVLPLERQNRAPVAIISPKEQTIRQPTTNAVLDGSMSSDDAKILSLHWEVVQAPLGYQPQLPEVTTLQLTDLNVPGNYTFKLTVMDSDNVTNSTTANITVLKGTDYPPVANAGKF